ncbi:MAG: EAL domain-containing protein [Synechococcus sp. ELA057]
MRPIRSWSLASASHRWIRFRRDCLQAARWRAWLPVIAGSTLLSALVLAATAIQSERYRNDLIRRFAIARLDFLANDLLVETRDWATWDESYKHVLGGNPDYYGNGNYNRDTFLRTPQVMVLDRLGRPVSTARWDPRLQRISPLSRRAETELLAVIPQRGRMEPRTFLAMFQARPYLMSAQLISPSAAVKPPAGRLLFMRSLLDADNAISRSTLELSAYRFEPARSIPSGFLGPLAITIIPNRWRGEHPIQISLLRPASERIHALVAFALLLLLDAVLVLWLLLGAYRQSRLQRLQNARVQQERRRLSRALQRRDSIDPLTGLLNSQGLVAAMTQQAADHPGLQQALLLLDIRRFALINNGLGRDVGDRILMAFGQWLKQLMPEASPIARTSVDVFGCALVGPSAAALRSRIDGLVSGLQQLDLQVDQRTVRLAVSAGARLLSDTTPEAAMHECGLACDLAKQSGVRPYQFYGESQQTMRRYIAIQRHNQDLISALNDQRIVLFGQVGWRLSEEKLPPVYLEFLARIHDPLSQTYRWSEALVEAATTCGSMTLLDSHVLHLSFTSIKRLLQSQGDQSALAEMVYAINLTPETLLADDFVYRVEALLQQEALDPRRLCFEITEQAAVRNFELLRSVMRHIRNIGIRFSLDDFGTGMTSLTYLHDLPLDYVKIDKSIIWRLKGETASRITVEFIVKLGRDLGFDVIAEGVETADLLQDLRELGVGIAQGYLTAIPSLFDPLSPSERCTRPGAELLGERRRQPA